MEPAVSFLDDPQTLVSTEWLSRNLHDRDLRVLDASMYLPDAGRDARAEYDAAHIPGAQFFGIDDICDRTSPLPQMAPSPDCFASRMQAMGLGDGQQVVVYDGSGLFSAARVWWTFRLMGKTRVAVLDGGMPKWRAEGRAVEAQVPVFTEQRMTVNFQSRLVKNSAQVAEAARTGNAEIIDARPAPRFRGEPPNPRPGLRLGHIPGSRNVPFVSLLNPDGTMRSIRDLGALFGTAGIDLKKPVITSCGTGVTAAMLSLTLERMGHRDHALYDGSWAEWGMREDLGIEIG
jgi:thiosulfate/3-mercaptopyruvate sulfurtransferase